ncbi:hypothetical protein Hanom_Chr03g00217381 [Helianthus anomalus]
MSDVNSIWWRIKLRSRRKKNRVKRTNNERVMFVSVKLKLVGNMQLQIKTFCRNQGLESCDGQRPLWSRHATAVVARDE